MHKGFPLCAVPIEARVVLEDSSSLFDLQPIRCRDAR
jgi:hypothetical protein